MATEKLNLGISPYLVIICRGDLDIRGVDRDDTRVQSDSGETEIRATENRAEIDCRSDCAIKMPHNGSVEATEVRGDLRVKEVSGQIAANEVGGSLYVREFSTLAVGNVLSEARVHELSGAVTLGSVQGCVTLREIGGPVTIDEVRGDLLARDVPHGLTVGTVNGNLALRTDFNLGTTSRFQVDGSASVRVGANASVRLIVSAGGSLSIPRYMESIAEGDYQVITFGSGEASVQIDAGGSLSIKQSGDYDLDDDAAFAYTFAAATDLSENLADLSEELDAQTAVIQAKAADISERVRRQVEQRLSVARRQVEAAQRRVEREVERGTRGPGSGRLSIDVNFGRPKAAPREPISEEERVAILKMLEEGKISVEDAQRLLAALEGSGE